MLPSSQRLLSIAATAAALALALGASPVHADDLSDFEAARRAYDAGSYEQAARLFERMVGGEVPQIDNEVLILESRKYLAVSYLFLTRRGDAETQFEALLAQDPSYQLDPVAFPDSAYELFREVESRVRERAAENAAEHEAAERARRDRTIAQLLEQQERIALLESLAREMVVVRENSRGLALLPFGIGQLRNGNRSFGLALAITQSFLLAGSIVSFGLHESLRGEPLERWNDPQFIRRERAYRITNIVSVSALGALVVIGITDAQVRYQGTVRTVVEREIPETHEGVSAELRFGLGSAELRLDF